MASAANLVSFNSDSEPDDDATYFEETFSSEHLGLGADPFPIPGELHLQMRPGHSTWYPGHQIEKQGTVFQ